MPLIKQDLTIARLKWGRIQQHKKHSAFLEEVRRRHNTALVQRSRLEEVSKVDPSLWLTAEEKSEYDRLTTLIKEHEGNSPGRGGFRKKSKRQQLLDDGFVEVPPIPHMPKPPPFDMADVVEVREIAPAGSPYQGSTEETYAMQSDEDAWNDYVDEQVWLRDMGKPYDQSVFEPVSPPEELDNEEQQEESIESILARTAGCEG